MTEWQYEPIQQLPPEALAANSRLMNAARTQLYRCIRWWLSSRFHFRVEGAEVFERVEQFVLIANHTSHLDTVCLLAAMPAKRRNRCYSAAAEDYFYTNAFKEQAARLLANTFPFRRRGDVANSLQACVRILERGDSLIFYPEGTRSATGELQPFRKGIGLLVQGRPFAVIPAHLSGAHEALGKGRLLPRASRLYLRLGAPQRFADEPSGEAAALAIAQRLHACVQALGQKEVLAG